MKKYDEVVNEEGEKKREVSIEKKKMEDLVEEEWVEVCK